MSHHSSLVGVGISGLPLASPAREGGRHRPSSPSSYGSGGGGSGRRPGTGPDWTSATQVLFVNSLDTGLESGGNYHKSESNSNVTMSDYK